MRLKDSLYQPWWVGSSGADAVGELLACLVCRFPPTPTPKMGAGEPESSKSLAQVWERDFRVRAKLGQEIFRLRHQRSEFLQTVTG